MYFVCSAVCVCVCVCVCTPHLETSTAHIHDTYIVLVSSYNNQYINVNTPQLFGRIGTSPKAVGAAASVAVNAAKATAATIVANAANASAVLGPGAGDDSAPINSVWGYVALFVFGSVMLLLSAVVLLMRVRGVR